MPHAEKAIDYRGHFQYDDDFQMSLNVSFTNVKDQRLIFLHRIHKQNPQVIRGLKLKN